jgi:formylglycine-generating enzyme required for sulfatase activity/dipeptide/tripeptide permease
MAAAPEQHSSSRSAPTGEAAHSADEPAASAAARLDADRARRRILIGVALVEFCAAAGEPLARGLAGTLAPASALNLHSWIAFIGAIPGGWLGDRFLGARRATVVGALLAVAGFGAIAVPWPGAVYVGLAIRAIGIALIRGNSFVLASRALGSGDQHRLEVFLWLGFASSVGATLASQWRQALPGVGLPMTAVAAVATLSVVAMAALRRSTAISVASLTSDGRSQLTGRLAAALGLTAAVAGAMLFGVERLAWGRVIADWLFPVSALVALLGFLMWWLRAARRLSRTENRRIGAFVELAVYAVLLGAFSALASAEPDESWRNWQRGFLGLACVSLPFVLRWRARTSPPPSAAGVFSVAFFLQSAGLIAFAALVVLDVNADGVAQVLLDALVIGSIGVAGVLVLAAGRSAATSLAPTVLAGTMLGIWRTSGAIGGNLGRLVPQDLDRDTLGFVLLAGAATCVLLGLHLQARRHDLARDEVAERLPPVAPSRLRLAAMAVSAVVAVLATAWVVVGRGIGGDTLVAATRSVTFGDSTSAHLPDDGLNGFVRLPPGPLSFGADPAVAGGTLSSPRATGQPIELGELYVAKYEVTVAQYRLCVDEGGCSLADARAIEGPDDWPVRHVSWMEANRYCTWLERKLEEIAPWAAVLYRTGLHVALPSEPEWERAASGRGVEGYPWQGPLVPARANYAASGRLAPVPVGEFTAGASPAGIYDLSGNVAEWTRSEFRAYPYDAGDGREDVSVAAATRVIRGGSYYDGESLLRVTARQAADPARGYEFVGFRVVITRVPQPPRQPATQQSAPPAAAQ